MSEIEQIEHHIARWVDQFIISLNLCPFAKAVFPKQTLIKVCPSENFEDVHQFLIQQIEFILSSDEKELATSIIATPFSLEEFDDFLDMLDILEAALEDTGLNEHIQIAPFHPNFEFEQTEQSVESSASLKTNQSPYPIFHFLRVNQVEKVLTSDDTAEKIVEKNKQVLNELGLEKIEALFESLKAKS